MVLFLQMLAIFQFHPLLINFLCTRQFGLRFYLQYLNNTLYYPHSLFLYLCFSSLNCSYRIVLLLPLRYLMKLDIAILGSISKSIYTWSRHTSISTIFTPFHSHNSLNISPPLSFYFPPVFWGKYYMVFAIPLRVW